jgi:Uma2 family endonuclease
MLISFCERLGSDLPCVDAPPRLGHSADVSAASTLSKEITEQDYLAAEAQAVEKHEYVDGAVYARAGASEAHNRIAARLIALLDAQLRGKPCEPFGSDMKVRVQVGTSRFYYPDAMVACEPEDSGHGWREKPKVLFEILSDETRRIDEQEKRFHYLQIPCLHVYGRIEQDRAAAVIDRRSLNEETDWKTEEVIGMEAVMEIPELGLRVPLRELYERVRLAG